MGTIDGELLNIDANIANANIVKEIVLTRLFQDGHIPEKTYDIFMENWQVIIIKRGWFKRWWKKFASKTDKESYQYLFVQFSDVKPETTEQAMDSQKDIIAT